MYFGLGVLFSDTSPLKLLFESAFYVQGGLSTRMSQKLYTVHVFSTRAA